mmetsp:Transcript_2137/g.4654  ORF Transcript_2137/g.4654 Transcript_2137/m.4654 type:complete len:399 (+) Transcript_2137:287-1483(+)|eukprot:scaffold1499_cov170-Amphora_coffeaeformis.AAC.17
MSLQELPQAIMRIILEYVPDTEILCHLDCTCRDIHTLIREDSLWRTRAAERWLYGTPLSSSQSGREEYIRRHILDMDMTKCLSRLSSTAEQLVMLYAFSHGMARGSEAMDICWKLWKNHKSTETQMFSRGFLRMLHCGSVCADMIKILNDDRSNRSPGERLEDACILTSAMFRDFNTGIRNTTADAVKGELQEMADKIQSEFTPQMSLRSKLQRVHTFFFDNKETRFSGNMQNYYDHQNSLLDVSLGRRKGIPMTLALLYKFICRRLDILVEIVGLPGHIVAHVPDLNTFVDVFEGGRFLTVEDCTNIVTTYGFPMQQSYLNALPPELIVQRILNNLENCLVRQPAISQAASARQRASITALRAIASNPRAEQLEECRHLLVLTWVSEACVGTDISDW